MTAESIREYCLKKPYTTESLPFDDTTLVFKVLNKIFVLMNLDGALSINLKCDPEKAIELREHYPNVLPGYHMNKKMWNTVMIDETIDPRLIMNWIDDSYNLIVEKLPAKERKLLDHENVI